MAYFEDPDEIYFLRRIKELRRAPQLTATMVFDLAADFDADDDVLEGIAGEFGAPADMHGFGLSSVFDKWIEQKPNEVAATDLQAIQENLIGQGYVRPGTEATGEWSPMWASAFRRADRDVAEEAYSGARYGTGTLSNVQDFLYNLAPQRVISGLVGFAKGFPDQAAESAERLGVGGGALAGAGIGAAVGGAVSFGALSVPAAAIGAGIGAIVGGLADLFGEDEATEDPDRSFGEQFLDVLSPIDEYAKQGRQAFFEDLGFVISTASVISGGKLVFQAAKNAPSLAVAAAPYRTAQLAAKGATGPSTTGEAAKAWLTRTTGTAAEAQAGLVASQTPHGIVSGFLSRRAGLAAPGTSSRVADVMAKRGFQAQISRPLIKTLNGVNTGLTAGSMGVRYGAGFGQDEDEFDAKTGRRMAQRTPQSAITTAIEVEDDSGNLGTVGTVLDWTVGMFFFPEKLLPFNLKAMGKGLDTWLGPKTLKDAVHVAQISEPDYGKARQLALNAFSVDEVGRIGDDFDIASGYADEALEFGISRLAARFAEEAGDIADPDKIRYYYSEVHRRIATELEGGTDKTLRQALTEAFDPDSRGDTFFQHLMDAPGTAASPIERLTQKRQAKRIGQMLNSMHQEDQVRFGLLDSPDFKTAKLRANLDQTVDQRAINSAQERIKVLSVRAKQTNDPGEVTLLNQEITSIKTQVKEAQGLLNTKRLATRSKQMHMYVAPKHDWNRSMIGEVTRDEVDDLLHAVRSGFRDVVETRNQIEEGVQFPEIRARHAEGQRTVRDGLDKLKQLRLLKEGEYTQAVTKLDRNQNLPKRILDRLDSYAKTLPQKVETDDPMVQQYLDQLDGLGYQLVADANPRVGIGTGTNMMGYSQIKDMASFRYGIDYSKRRYIWESVLGGPERTTEHTINRAQFAHQRYELGLTFNEYGFPMDAESGMGRLINYLWKNNVPALQRVREFRTKRELDKAIADGLIPDVDAFGPLIRKRDVPGGKPRWELFKLNLTDLSTEDIKRALDLDDLGKHLPPVGRDRRMLAELEDELEALTTAYREAPRRLAASGATNKQEYTTRGPRLRQEIANLRARVGDEVEDAEYIPLPRERHEGAAAIGDLDTEIGKIEQEMAGLTKKIEDLSANKGAHRFNDPKNEELVQSRSKRGELRDRLEELKRQQENAKAHSESFVPVPTTPISKRKPWQMSEAEFVKNSYDGAAGLQEIKIKGKKYRYAESVDLGEGRTGSMGFYLVKGDEIVKDVASSFHPARAHRLLVEEAAAKGRRVPTEIKYPQADFTPPENTWQMMPEEFERFRPEVEGMLYHGSPQGAISQIDPDKLRESWGGMGKGFYVTTSREASGEYARGLTTPDDQPLPPKTQGRANYIVDNRDEMFVLDLDAAVDEVTWLKATERLGLDLDDLKGRSKYHAKKVSNRGVRMAAIHSLMETMEDNVLIVNKSFKDRDALYQKAAAQVDEALVKQGGVDAFHQKEKIAPVDPLIDDKWKDSVISYDAWAIKNLDKIKLANAKTIHRREVLNALMQGKPVPTKVREAFGLDEPPLPKANFREVDVQRLEVELDPDEFAQAVYDSLKRGGGFGGELAFTKPGQTARAMARAMRISGGSGLMGVARTWRVPTGPKGNVAGAGLGAMVSYLNGGDWGDVFTGAAAGVVGPSALRKTKIFDQRVEYLPQVLSSLNTALRYSLSPTFDMGRYIEQNLLAKTIGKFDIPFMMRPEKYIAKRRWKALPEFGGGREGFVTGDDAVAEMYRFFEIISGSKWINATDESIRALYQKGVLGFSPLHFEAAQAYILKQKGWSDDAIREAVARIGRYGLGRSNMERTVHMVIFPFSFTKKLLEGATDFITTAPVRDTLIAGGLEWFDRAGYDEAAAEWAERHLPLFQELKKLNFFAYGIGAGRPLLKGFAGKDNFGKAVQGLTALMVPQGAAQPLHDAFGGLGSEVIHFFTPVGITGENMDRIGDIIGRYIPAVRDFDNYKQALEEQGRSVIEGAPSYIQTREYIDTIQDKKSEYENLAKLMGFSSVDGFLRSEAGMSASMEIEALDSELSQKYPTGYELANEFVNDERETAKAMQALLDRDDISEDEQAILKLYEYQQQAFRLGQLSGMKREDVMRSIADRMRHAAVFMLGRNQFESLWAEHFADIYGPITQLQAV